MFYVLTDRLATRSALAAHLKAEDILSVSHYVPLHSSPAGRKCGRSHGALPVTKDISERLLRLPIYFSMSDADIDSVIDAVQDFFKSRA